MSTTTNKPTTFFLGATGGCALAALILTLNAGNPAIALVRTPSKLTKLLTDAGVSESTVSSLLTIHAGNALDAAAVKKALLTDSSALPSTILSGLGGAPQIQFDIWAPLRLFTLDNPKICQTAAATLVSALNDIYASQPKLAASKPLLGFISTTGISRGKEDVPFLMRFLYHQLLHVPHMDKREMENVFRDANPSPFRAVIGIRPTLLTDGAELGLEKVRVGREQAPELGYTISRKDVGRWVFTNMIEGQGKGWENDMASLTY